LAVIKARCYPVAVSCVGGVVVLAWATFLWPQFKEANAERKCGISHVFSIAQTPAFLPDDLALTKAIETVRLQGFDTNRWRAAPDAQTKAPDGTEDRFLGRNIGDDNRGVVTFTNSIGSTRHVDVRLSNSVVICVVRAERRPVRARDSFGYDERDR
jgi:hypothetical protein